jgi:hypothetical protein
VHWQVTPLHQPLSPTTSSVVPGVSSSPRTLFSERHFWGAVRTLTLAIVNGSVQSTKASICTIRFPQAGELVWLHRNSEDTANGLSSTTMSITAVSPSSGALGRPKAEGEDNNISRTYALCCRTRFKSMSSARCFGPFSCSTPMPLRRAATTASPTSNLLIPRFICRYRPLLDNRRLQHHLLLGNHWRWHMCRRSVVGLRRTRVRLKWVTMDG